MNGIEKLLGVSASPLARTLRDSLIGLRAALEFAVREAPDDSGAEAARDVLDELNFLLRAPSVLAPLDGRREATTRWREAPPVAVPARDGWALLKQELQADEALRIEVGPVQLQAVAAPELWQEIQYLLLRASSKRADRWRQRVREIVVSERCTEDMNAAQLLPGDNEELVFSGLAGDVRALGLRVSPQAPLDERVKMHYMQADTTNPELRSLAQAVSLCLAMIERDAHLHHALQAVNALAVTSLRDVAQRLKFEQALVDYYGDVCRSPCDSVEGLKARLRLDEAIHSLVHRPPAQRTSWWGSFRQRCRDLLFRSAESLRARDIAELRELPLSYRNAQGLTKDDIPINCSNAPGDVLASLRVWAKIEQREYRGRAIYSV